MVILDPREVETGSQVRLDHAVTSMQTELIHRLRDSASRIKKKPDTWVLSFSFEYVFCHVNKLSGPTVSTSYMIVLLSVLINTTGEATIISSY